jgi:hypothetical protein
MSFQAEVGTWLAAHVIAEVPIGIRFNLSPDVWPLRLRFETGTGLIAETCFPYSAGQSANGTIGELKRKRHQGTQDRSEP